MNAARSVDWVEALFASALCFLLAFLIFSFSFAVLCVMRLCYRRFGALLFRMQLALLASFSPPLLSYFLPLPLLCFSSSSLLPFQSHNFIA